MPKVLRLIEITKSLVIGLVSVGLWMFILGAAIILFNI